MIVRPVGNYELPDFLRVSIGLAQATLTCLALPPGATVLEIGSHQGRSTVVLGRALRARSGSLVCVDPFVDGRLFGVITSVSREPRAPLDAVLLVTSHDRPDVVCRPVSGDEVADRMRAVCRDSDLVAFDYDERDPGVLEMLRQAVVGAHRNGRSVGICGEAPATAAAGPAPTPPSPTSAPACSSR